MHPKTLHPMLVFSILVMLCFSCLLSVQSVNCASSSLSFLAGPAGGVCMAEQTTPASRSIDSHRSQSAVMPTLLVLLGLCALCSCFSRRILKTDLYFSFWKRCIEPLLGRTGPIPRKTFIPEMFATHGL